MPCTACKRGCKPPRLFSWLVALALAAPASAPAGELADLADGLVGHYVTRTPVAGPAPLLTAGQARVVQGAVVATLEPVLGAPIGYKAGLTSPPAQEKFGVAEPLRGVLLRSMVLDDGATLPAAFGARPFAEGDLLVRVGSEAINTATTPEEALAALSAVIPFMELPDILYAEGVALDGPAITAVNVGARYGIAGDPIPLTPGGDWMRRLAEFQVVLTDAGGATLAQGTGDALLGHPLNVVLWLARSLNRDNVRLKPGDLLSLGSLTPLVPVAGPGTIQARYEGLDPAGPVVLTAHFAPAIPE